MVHEPITLSAGQFAALRAAVEGHNLFITGPGGTGKSVLLERIVEELAVEKTVAVTASTGIAAIRVGGCTIHSWLGTQIKKNRAELAKMVSEHKIKDRKRIEQRLRRAQVLVIDEISMLSGDYIEMVDFWLKRMRRSLKPFGGLQVIFTGDFLQLPPVAKRGEHFEYQYAFESPPWMKVDMRVHALKEVFRQEDQEFIDMLMRVRVGDLDPLIFAYFNSRTGETLPDDPTRLFARNDSVHAVNFEHLRKHPGKARTFDAELEGDDEWAEKLVRDSVADAFLELKIGAPVLFLYNDYEVGFVNGERGTVMKMDEERVHVEKWDGHTVCVQRVAWQAKDADDKVQATMRQFPLKLAWAMTIHKSQGMTLDLLECDVSQCFAPGQTYVALSRVREYEGLTLTEPMQGKHIMVDPTLVEFCESVEG